MKVKFYTYLMHYFGFLGYTYILISFYFSFIEASFAMANKLTFLPSAIYLSSKPNTDNV